MNLLEQAREAVRLSRDFAPADGRRFTPAESETLGRLCRDAYLACQAAGVSISEVRLELWREGQAAYRAALLRGEVTV
jgi:hypothetical protein